MIRNVRSITTSPELLLVPRPCTHDDYRDVRLLSCLDGFRKTAPVITPPFTSLRVGDPGRFANSSTYTIKRRHSAVLASLYNVVSVL
jgi:hypothetical protein